MNSRFSEGNTKTKSLRKTLVQANTGLLLFCFLVTTLEIAVILLAWKSNELAIKIEEKFEAYLYSVTVQSIFLGIAGLLSILQFILTSDKCGNSCQCHIFVTLK